MRCCSLHHLKAIKLRNQLFQVNSLNNFFTKHLKGLNLSCNSLLINPCKLLKYLFGDLTYLPMDLRVSFKSLKKRPESSRVCGNNCIRIMKENLIIRSNKGTISRF